MQERQNIAVFVDYDNIEIGVKSTLRREFAVSHCLDALKERGDIVAKFAYANWSRQEGAVRQMAENAVQMVQRLPSPRGDKNGADINLALDALEMAFTHKNVNAFAIISGDSDFIPLVNKLKAYGKTIYIVGGKAFTSTILQQNCHEFISYESLLDDSKFPVREAPAGRPTPIPSATALLAASAPLPASVTLTAVYTDDGLPKPRKAGPPAVPGAEPRPAKSPLVKWVYYRGPALNAVSFEPERTTITTPANQTVTTVAKFKQPGTYVLRAWADDTALYDTHEIQAVYMQIGLDAQETSTDDTWDASVYSIVAPRRRAWAS